MKKRLSLLPLAVLIAASEQLPAQKLWGKLQAGIHAVGFRTIRQADPSRNNRPLIISVWYPAKSKGQPMVFSDYLFSGMFNASFSVPTEDEKKIFAKEFKDILLMPHLFGLREESLQQYETVLKMPVMAQANAPGADGKFPTVIMSSEPESLSVTAEYLASHGFAVVAIHAPNNQEMPPETLVWDAATKDLVWLSEYTKKIDCVDQNKIAAMGFGGGIIPAFYLTMKTNQLKGLVNLDGAVFQPFSLITKSADYHPEKMKTPMLHIVSARTRQNESEDEIKAIQTVLYRFLAENDQVIHHDFSIFGRIVNQGLGLRNHIAAEAEVAYVAAHQLILDFLNNCMKSGKTEFNRGTMKGILKPEQ